MPVSELEKNPERKISATRIEKSKPSGASFNADLDLVENGAFYLEEKGFPGQVPSARALSGPVQNQLQHQFGAKEREYQ